MPNPITYNGGTAVSGNLNRNGLAVGVNSLDFGSSPGGKTWYTGIEPEGFLIYSNTYSQGSTTQGNGRPTAWGTSDSSDAGLLSLINYLPAREGLAKFSDLASAITWLEGTGNYIIINKSYPNIVTSNLKSLTDASFTASYPRTGTTCYDMSGNANNGTLYNGPTLNSSAGYFQFDGTDDYMAIPNPGSTGSIQFSFYWTGLAQKVITGNIGGGYAMVYNGGSGVVVHWYPASGTYDFYGLLPNRAGWYNIALTWNGTSDNKMYMNGTLVMSSTSYSISKPPIWFFAGNHYSPQAIRIQSILTYDKVLSQAEVLQNHYLGNIVTSSLLVNYDASNIVSYANGATTAYNLYGTSSGTTNGTLSINNDATLNNGVSYSTARGGVWSFDGTDDYMSFNIDSSVINTAGELTFNIWYRVTSSGVDTSLLEIGGNYSNWSLYWDLVDPTGCLSFSVTGSYPQRVAATTNTKTGGWFNSCGTFSNGTARIYTNGRLEGTRTSISLLSQTGTKEGRIANDSGNHLMGGNVGIVQIYNRALSANEVLQNFNAQRNRFGI